jgi:hypothetical protein
MRAKIFFITLAMYVGRHRFREVSCRPRVSPTRSAELGDTVMTSTIINLAAGGVLLVAAPIAGYGFGYDSAAQEAGRPLSMRATIVPRLVAGGGRQAARTGRSRWRHADSTSASAAVWRLLRVFHRSRRSPVRDRLELQPVAVGTAGRSFAHAFAARHAAA